MPAASSSGSVRRRAVARTTVNYLAQFSLRGLPPGVYTAELVGAAFTAAAGEVIQLAHTIPNIAHGMGRVLSSATTTALSTAASGVLAISPGAPVTPGS